MTLLLLLQLSDSAFPSGGFTHSNGLEAAVHYRVVRSPDDVRRLVTAGIWQAAHGAWPFVSAAHGDPARVAAIDARADLFLNQPISNRASRSQGQALLRTARLVFPDATVQPLSAAAATDEFCGHYAPIFGALMRLLNADLTTAGRLFLYQAARSMLSAAMRLGVIGMFDAQRLQLAAGADIDRALRTVQVLGVDDAAQTAPIVDLYQSTQDRLYSRLFQS